MVNKRESDITVHSIFEDALAKKYYPRRFNQVVVARQLRDRDLSSMDLTALTAMNLSELDAAIRVSPEERTEADEEAEKKVQKSAVKKKEVKKESRASGPLTQKINILLEEMDMKAKIFLVTSNEDPEPPTLPEMREALTKAGVVHGIKEEYLERLAERPVYGQKFIVAEGTVPADGDDEQVKYEFQMKADLSPAINERGKADYKSLDYAKNVKEGDLLCTLTPATSGMDGKNVLGEPVPAKAGKPSGVSPGSNASFSLDQKQIFSKCDGQAHLRGNKILVSRTLQVPNVDISTGNVLFVGSVEVDGVVASGYTVRAGGDIVVRGVVENATLIAGGNIVLMGGMKGMETGLLDAGESIRTVFIENARARAKNSIFADVILNSKIDCGQSVILSGTNGKLLGGICNAGKSIQAMQIGNEANIATEIHLKNIEEFMARQEQINRQITKLEETAERLTEYLTSVMEEEEDSNIRQIMLTRTVFLRQRIEREVTVQRKKMVATTDVGLDRSVSARTMYPNTSIEIEGLNYKNKLIKYNCLIQKVKGEIKASASSTE